MIEPAFCRFMMGAACFMPSITERTSSAIAASKPATGTLSMLPVGAGPPALLKRASSRPWRSKVKRITRSQSASLVASACTKIAAAPIRLATASPSGLRRPVNTTLAPSATKSSAVLVPMPLVPPVTIATLPSSIPILVSLKA